MERIASAARGLRHVFLRDMVLAANIGIHPHEHGKPQRVRINVDLAVADDATIAIVKSQRDELSRVVDYEAIADTVRLIVRSGHIKLVETLAERIAEACLEDRRVDSARIRVEKLDVFADAASAGVEIERKRADFSTR